ncbi:MAG: zonular occludens toxin domain-containing protein [Methylococcus sp.]|nr:zonular occludens toxin domain-containing protein [Methylococcus sp.]
MSIKIHHGPPGSYKTSGAVMDDFIPAARAGRVVVTNVRGLDSVERVRAALGDDTVPESFEIVHLPTTEHPDSDRNRALLARWWHWLPHGAFMLLDEAQMIWPKTWKDADLKELDYPGGLEAANAANRPFNWQTAFEMHRHYGWDMVLTTPNIDRLRPDVRQCAEGAYKHKNQAMIGLKGWYLEAFHLADDTGKSASDFMTLRNRRIKKEVWKLYDSTATGNFSDTLAGLSIFKNPRVVFLLAVLLLAGYSVLRGGGPKFLHPDRYASSVMGQPAGLGPSPSPDASAVPVVAASRPGVAAGPGAVPLAADVGRAVPARPAAVLDPLGDRRLILSGRYGRVDDVRYLFLAESDTDFVHLSDRDMIKLGYRLHFLSDCLVRVSFGDAARLVTCTPSKRLGSRTDHAEPASRDNVGGAAQPVRQAAR